MHRLPLHKLIPSGTFLLISGINAVNVFSSVFTLFIEHNLPRGGGGGVDSHIKGAGMLVGNFELNP